MSHEHYKGPVHNLGPEKTKDIPDGASIEAPQATPLSRKARRQLLERRSVRYLEPVAEDRRFLNVTDLQRQKNKRIIRRAIAAGLTVAALAGPVSYLATDHPSRHSDVSSTTEADPPTTVFDKRNR